MSCLKGFCLTKALKRDFCSNSLFASGLKLWIRFGISPLSTSVPHYIKTTQLIGRYRANLYAFRNYVCSSNFSENRRGSYGGVRYGLPIACMHNTKTALKSYNATFGSIPKWIKIKGNLPQQLAVPDHRSIDAVHL